MYECALHATVSSKTGPAGFSLHNACFDGGSELFCCLRDESDVREKMKKK